MRSQLLKQCFFTFGVFFYTEFSGISLLGYYVHHTLHTRRHRPNLLTGAYFENSFIYKRDVYFVANNLRLLLKFQKCVSYETLYTAFAV